MQFGLLQRPETYFETIQKYKKMTKMVKNDQICPKISKYCVEIFFIDFDNRKKSPPLQTALKYDLSVQLSSEKDMLELRHFFWMCGKFRYVHTTGTEISTREKKYF